MKSIVGGIDRAPNHVSDHFRVLFEHSIGDPKDSPARQERMVVTESIVFESLKGRMPCAPVYFDDQSPLWIREIDSARSGRPPRERKLKYGVGKTPIRKKSQRQLFELAIGEEGDADSWLKGPSHGPNSWLPSPRETFHLNTYRIESRPSLDDKSVDHPANLCRLQTRGEVDDSSNGRCDR